MTWALHTDFLLLMANREMSLLGHGAIGLQFVGVFRLVETY